MNDVVRLVAIDKLLTSTPSSSSNYLPALDKSVTLH